MPPRTTPFNLTALLQLTRFWNLTIIVLTQYVAAVFLLHTDHLWDWRLFILASSTAILAAAGYIINDYYDIKIDLINKPQRVVIGKSIARRYALLFHSVLTLLGIALGFLLGWKIGIIHFLSAFLLWWYSNHLKRLPFIGNFVVALLTGIAVLLVNVLYDVTNVLITIYALFAFFMTLVREIIKDMEDLKGDNTFGCKTLPIEWGIRKTKVALYFLLALFSAMVLVMNVFFAQLPHYYFLVFLFIPLLIFVLKLRMADTRKEYHALSTWCKVIMVFGMISMIFIQ
jgi:4-hydroxybenzoate polyprenyltransferase